MGTALLLIAGLAILVVLLTSKTNTAPFAKTLINPYYSKKPLTETEALFHQRLVQALPECIVLSQVQLSRFINVDRIKAGRDFYKYFNAIAQQSVDYLICLKDFTIVAAVELDDKSHNSKDAQKRDVKKTRNLKAAEIPLIRWHAEFMPSIEQIRTQFSQDIQDVIQRLSPTPWLNEDQEAYFLRINAPRPPWKGVVPLALVVVLILIIFTAVQGVTQSFKKLTSTPQQIVAPSITKTLEQQAQQQVQLEKMQHQKGLEEAKKREELAAREAKNQQQIEAMRNAALKEEAWQKFYQQSQQCQVTGNLITCGNEYARARKQFEEQWAVTHTGNFLK